MQTGTVAFVDGGSRGNRDAAAAAYFPLSNETVSKFLGKKTNNEAEYAGLILALNHVLESGLVGLKVYSDSELMVKQMQGKYRTESESLRPLWLEAFGLSQKLDYFEIQHVPREANKIADAEVNVVLDRIQGK